MSWIILRFAGKYSLFSFAERFLISILSFYLAYLQKPNNFNKKYQNLAIIYLFSISYYSLYNTYISAFSPISILLNFLITFLCFLSFSDIKILALYFLLNFFGNFISASLSIGTEFFLEYIITLLITYISIFIILYHNIKSKSSLLYDESSLLQNIYPLHKGIIVTNLNSIILYINKLASEIVSKNFNIDLLLGSSINFPIKDQLKFLGIQYTIETESGKFIEVQYSKILWNQELCNLILISNISDKIYAEKAISNYSKMSNQILENTSEGLIFIDSSGKILYANPKSLNLFFTTSEELLGQNYNLFINPSLSQEEDENREHPIYLSISEGKSFQISREKFWKLNGDFFYSEYACSPVYENSTLIGSILSFRDISFKVLRDKEEENYKNELLHLSRTSNKFLEIVSESELYKFIVEEIYNFFPNSQVILNIYDPLSNFFTTVAHCGFETKMNEIYSVLGRDLKGITYSDESLNPNSSDHTEISSLFDIRYGNFNRKTCIYLEKIINANHIISLSFNYKSMYLGNCILFANQNLSDFTPTFEVFQNQCSIHLFKKYSSRQLFRDKLRTDPFILSISLPYFEINQNGFILFINPYFEQFSGFSFQEVSGKNFWSLFHPESKFEEINSFIKKMKINSSQNFKGLFYTKNNGSIPIHWDAIMRGNPEFETEIISCIGKV